MRKGITQIQTSKGPYGISVILVSYRVKIASVPWLVRDGKRELKEKLLSVSKRTRAKY
jgi:hypothetical protein